MRTLDPNDLQFRPNYVNNVDSADFATSKGFNYHQGPEWVWCLGYFLRARLHFSSDKGKATLCLWNNLVSHIQHLETSAWVGLPEICNLNGSHCPDGCPTQAWSASTLLDALYDAAQI